MCHDTAYCGLERPVVSGVSQEDHGHRGSQEAGKQKNFRGRVCPAAQGPGTDAIASYTVLRDDKKGDHTVIAAKMKEQGADAVLITRLVSKKTVQIYIPGSVYYPPSAYRPWRDHYPPYYGTWRDYYGYGYQAMYTPGYIAEDEYALMETNLYNAGNDNLLWSALSETEIMGSDQNLIKSYIGVMVNSMSDHKLLK